MILDVKTNLKTNLIKGSSSVVLKKLLLSLWICL